MLLINDNSYNENCLNCVICSYSKCQGTLSGLGKVHGGEKYRKYYSTNHAGPRCLFCSFYEEKTFALLHRNLCLNESHKNQMQLEF